MKTGLVFENKSNIQSAKEASAGGVIRLETM